MSSATRQPVTAPLSAPYGEAGPPLGYLMAAVGASISRSWRDALVRFDLHPRHFSVLRSVAADQGQNQQACGEVLQIPASRVVALVDDLENRGLLQRRVNPADRRTRSLYLTDAGRRQLDALMALVEEHERKLFDDLTDPERAVLRSVLVRQARRFGLDADHTGRDDGDEDETCPAAG